LTKQDVLSIIHIVAIEVIRMKWSLMQLNKLRNLGQLQVNETIELNELVALHPDIRAVQPVHVRANASFTSNQLIFNLRITGEMTLPDARTLNDVAYPFEIESIEPFLLEGEGWTILSEEDPEETEPKIDPRLAGLAQFFKKDQDS